MNDHIPVLLHEVIEALNIKPGKKYIDTTLGMGGHAREIVAYGGLVLGLDRDSTSLEYVKTHTDTTDITLVHGSFKDIKQLANDHGFYPADGILFDLGFSSWQLDSAGRGFSFTKDEPLDLRFDSTSDEPTAQDIVNTYSRDLLITILSRYGELQDAEQIAQVLIKHRPFVTTSELNACIAKEITGGMVPALLARIYQALRITVNAELKHIEIGLLEAVDVLDSGGRLAVISFHSLEDRIVKLTFRQTHMNEMTKKPVRATQEEIKQNSRSRSAKLRVLTKI